MPVFCRDVTHPLIIKDLYSDVHLCLCFAGTAHCANMYLPTDHKDLYSDVHLCLCFAGTAHCANMYPPTSSDPAALVKARASISKLIGKWIA